MFCDIIRRVFRLKQDPNGITNFGDRYALGQIMSTKSEHTYNFVMLIAVWLATEKIFKNVDWLHKTSCSSALTEKKCSSNQVLKILATATKTRHGWT